MKFKYLGVFVFYDKNGIVDKYVEILLDAFAQNIQDIIVIVNGNITTDSYKKLMKYAKMVYVRDNIGYDAGAYKDFYIKYSSITEWEKYDAILMMNDTFYGPLYPLEELMNMINSSKADFGGITMHPINEGNIEEHIQSYFLFVKGRLIHDRCYKEYWERLLYPANHEEAVLNFEIAFTTYFKNKGYVYETYDGAEIGKPCWKDGKNTYLYHSYDLIIQKRVPFLKKECFSLASPQYEYTIKILRYLETNMKFNSEVLWQNIYRLSRENLFRNFYNYYELEKFYSNHSNIYIYGAGEIAHALEKYFEYRNWKFSCFIISNNQIKKDVNTKYLSEIFLEENEGIIVAVGLKNCVEIYNIIRDVFEKEQVLLPQMFSRQEVNDN